MTLEERILVLEETVLMLTLSLPKKRFTPPTIVEVSEYFLSKGYPQDVAVAQAELFWNHYDARGWVIGKVKMSKWRSAVNTWITNMNNYAKSNGSGAKPGSSEARLDALRKF